MGVSRDGSTVYVAATSGGSFVVMADVATTGARRWTTRTVGPGGAQLFARAIAVSSDGTRLFVTGEVEHAVDTRSTITVAYDTADGGAVWSARLSVGNHREAIPRRIAVSPDGSRVFVTGSKTGSHGPDDSWDYFTAGYSASSGTRTWMATFDGRRHGGDTSEELGVIPNGRRVFVTGTSLGVGTDRDFVTIAYGASSGSRIWKARFDVGADDFATDLVVSPDGSRVYVGGFGRPSIEVPHGFRVVAYRAATGTRLREGLYADGGDDFAVDLAISGDGSRVFMTGADALDFITVAFRASLGQPLWGERYDGGHGIDHANSVAVSPDGDQVFVTGLSERGRVACFSDIRSTTNTTVQYDAAAGSQGWVARYQGLTKSPDEGIEVAVSSDGALVFVTGNSDFGCRSSDVATLGYRTS